MDMNWKKISSSSSKTDGKATAKTATDKIVDATVTQVSGKESVKNRVLDQVKPGLDGALDLGWSSHNRYLGYWGILSLLAEVGQLGRLTKNLLTLIT
jgi:hypothetical protein